LDLFSPPLEARVLLAKCNRRHDVWLHLASLKEIPSEETWKLFIMFSFRKDYSLTQREEF